MHCLVIGAGACGLMSAAELLKRGARVTIIEARNRLGGRICTVPVKPPIEYVEKGAEFIHGNMPITTGLLNEGKRGWRAAEGKTYLSQDSLLTARDFFDDQWALLLQHLKDLKSEVTFAEFLQQKFPGEKHERFRERMKGFVEGYNAADTTRVSAIALREEWTNDAGSKQYRPVDGYGSLVKILEDRVTAGGAEIHLSEIAEHLEWKANDVRLKTRSAKIFEAEKAVITVPIGVLQHKRLRFTPGIPEYNSAAHGIGSGSVIKFHLIFNDAFWEDGRSPLRDLGFLHSDAPVPTWWTQLPSRKPLLTGWLGGPRTAAAPQEFEELYRYALESLGHALNIPRHSIEARVREWHVTDWGSDDFSLGAYSYVTPETREARKLLNTAIAETIYFAGEAIDEGPHNGTVEAALSSGIAVANKIAEASRKNN